MMNTFEYGFSELGIGEESIGRLLGSGNEYPYDEFSGLVMELLENASRVCSVKAEYIICPVEEWNSDRQSVTLKGVIFNLKHIVYRQLRKSESIAIFLCTAGPGPETLVRKAMEDGDPFASYIYDIIGSEIAEHASRLILKEVTNAAEISGMKVTNRYSPGYCGWDVSDQHGLFRLMPDNSCGISLNDSALMSPEKSASGMIGIGNDVSFDPYPCITCPRIECLYRKTHE